MTDDLIARLRSVDVSWSETGEWCAEAADRIEALTAEVELLQAEVADLIEPSPYCELCGSCGDEGCGCTHKCKYAFDHPEVSAEVERLRERLAEAYQIAGHIAVEYDGNGKIERLLDLLLEGTSDE